MCIIAVGGAGTIGSAVVDILSTRHDVVVVGRPPVTSGSTSAPRPPCDPCTNRSGTSTRSSARPGKRISGRLARRLRKSSPSECTASFLVRSASSSSADRGSLPRLIHPRSGYLFVDPIPEAVSFAVANGGVEGFGPSPSPSTARFVSTPSARGWPRQAPNSSASSTLAARPYPAQNYGSLHTQCGGMANRRSHPGPGNQRAHPSGGR